MHSKGVALWMILLLATLATLAGCGARSGGGETATASTNRSLLLDLPALIIDYDAEGKPSLGSTALAELGNVLPNAVVSQLTLDKTTVDTFTAANLQHLQVSNTPSGLRVLANGQPLPTIVWDRTALDNLTALLGKASPGVVATLRDLLPIITDLGVGIVGRFPPSQGTATIPLVVQGAASNAAAAQAAEQSFVASAGSRPAIQIPVYYAVDGTWTVEGITDTEWQALTGLPFGGLRLSPGLLQDIKAAGIKSATVRADAQGIHLALDGVDFPYLSWEGGGVRTAIDLAQQFGLLRDLPLDPATLDNLLATWLPAIQSSNVTIQVSFPQE